MRPLGGIVFGYIGDQYSQGKALYMAITLIAIPTFLIGLLPPVAVIGPSAVVILIVFRLLQGLSAGGQYSGALTFLRTQNGIAHGARAASIAYMGCVAGYLLASIVGYFATRFLHNEFAWRLPFIFTVLFIPALFFCRKGLLEEVEEHSQDSAVEQAAIIRLWHQHKWLTFKITLLACVGGVYYSSFFIFLISFMKVHVQMQMSDILLINIICLISSGILIYFFAKLADTFGRKPICIFGSLALVILIKPAFLMIGTGSFDLALLGVWLLTTANTAFMAAMAVVYVESFPKNVQFTGCAIAYNIGAGVIGGLTPAFLTFLLHVANVFAMVVFLIAVAAFAAVFMKFYIKETHRGNAALNKAEGA